MDKNKGLIKVQNELLIRSELRSATEKVFIKSWLLCCYNNGKIKTEKLKYETNWYTQNLSSDEENKKTHEISKCRVILFSSCGFYEYYLELKEELWVVSGSTLNILSNWSWISLTPGKAGTPVIISVNMQPTPHMSRDVE